MLTHPLLLLLCQCSDYCVSLRGVCEELALQDSVVRKNLNCKQHLKWVCVPCFTFYSVPSLLCLIQLRNSYNYITSRSSICSNLTNFVYFNINFQKLLEIKLIVCYFFVYLYPPIFNESVSLIFFYILYCMCLKGNCWRKHEVPTKWH
jgi:hypothetical protein